MSLKTARLVIRGVGGIAVVCALLGLLYNAASFYGFATGAIDKVEMAIPVPYVRPAFFIMSSIFVASYVVLLWCGIQFVRLSASLWWLFTTILVVEVVSYLVMGYLWRDPVYGPSVAAASGISGGGVMPQLIILFPIWALPAVWFARKSLTTSDGSDGRTG